MDHQRFDEMTRLLSRGRSRRDVLKVLTVGLVAGFFSTRGQHHAEAQTCGVLGDDCTGNADCCTGLVCFEALCDNPSGLCMSDGEFCGSDGLECCEGLSCVDLYCEPSDACGVLGDDCDSISDCCNGLTCFEAICDNPSGLCMDEGDYCGSEGLECCSGFECVDSYCVPTSLPSTGVGSSISGGVNSSALGIGAAAGVAAVLLGKRLRAQEVPVVADQT